MSTSVNVSLNDNLAALSRGIKRNSDMLWERDRTMTHLTRDKRKMSDELDRTLAGRGGVNQNNTQMGKTTIETKN